MTLTTWIIVWLICGFICSAISSNKGHNAGSWFVIGILFGPLAILAVLAQSKAERIIELDSINDGSGVKCQFCAELIKKEALVCKHCGRDLPKTTSNSMVVEKTEYKSSIIDGDLPKLKNLISVGSDISTIRNELIDTANAFDQPHIAEYLLSLK